MNKIPTARHLSSGLVEAKRMIEFARLHVEAALQAAAKDVHLIDCNNYNHGKTSRKYNANGHIDIKISETSILNAYPKELIK